MYITTPSICYSTKSDDRHPLLYVTERKGSITLDMAPPLASLQVLAHMYDFRIVNHLQITLSKPPSGLFASLTIQQQTGSATASIIPLLRTLARLLRLSHQPRHNAPHASHRLGPVSRI